MSDLRTLLAPVFIHRLFIPVAWGFIGVGIFMNLWMLDHYQDWHTDFALYLHQTRALTDGTYSSLESVNTDMMNHGRIGPNLYPIGYPLLLVVFFGMGLTSILQLKLVTFTFFLIGLFFLYKLLQLWDTSRYVLLLTLAAVVFSPVFSDRHHHLLSDVPNYTLIILALYCWERFIRRQPSTLWLASALVFVFAAMLTRTASIVLIPALFFHYAYVHRKNWRDAGRAHLRVFVVLLFIPVLYAVLNAFLPLNRGDNEFSYLLKTLSVQTLADNIRYYVQVVSGSLSEPPRFWKIDSLETFSWLNPFLKGWSMVLIILYTGIFACLLYNWVKRKGQLASEDLLMLLVSLFTVMVYLIWPDRQGVRFIILLFPFIYLKSFHVLAAWSRRSGAGLLLTGFLFCSIIGSLFLQFPIHVLPGKRLSMQKQFEEKAVPNSDAFNQAMVFLRDSIPPGSIIGSNRPRAVHFYTGKKAYILNKANMPYFHYVLIREWDGDQCDLTAYRLAASFSTLKIYKRY